MTRDHATGHRLLPLLCGLLLALPSAGWAATPRLRVSENHRYLVDDDGRPFFYLGDTAWELFHRLDREEAQRYLADRAAKGFTVIQAVALAELDGLNAPNANGHRPLIDNDPARPDVEEGPDNDYWDHVDEVVREAARLDLFIGLLPTWGDKWSKKWGVGPEVFTPANAKQYGEWLGRRYRDQPIIWILGGDRNPDDERGRAVTRAMAAGLKAGHGGTQLMTFHPQGGSNSATWFQQDDWLDFNMIQSGHGRPGTPNYETLLQNLALTPPKPTLDGEPCYEDHPVKGQTWNRRDQPGVRLDWFDEWDVRVAAYQALLAGACGHTYGDHNIWQMWLPGREPLSVARTPWPAALEHPGALQMKYLRGLFEARPFWKLSSDQSLVVADNPREAQGIRAAVAHDGTFAVLYLPTGGPVIVDQTGLQGDRLRAWWFNPRQNASQLIGTFEHRKSRTFAAPSSGRNNDWVLVIEDADLDLPRLGTSYQNIIPVVDE